MGWCASKMVLAGSFHSLNGLSGTNTWGVIIITAMVTTGMEFNLPSALEVEAVGFNQWSVNDGLGIF